MRQVDPQFFPGELKALDVGGNQIQQQYAANQITAGKYRHLPAGTLRAPPDNEAAEPPALRQVETIIHLGHRPEKNQQHRQSKTDDGQSERGEKLDNAVGHVTVSIWQTRQTLLSPARLRRHRPAVYRTNICHPVAQWRRSAAGRYLSYPPRWPQNQPGQAAKPTVPDPPRSPAA